MPALYVRLKIYYDAEWNLLCKKSSVLVFLSVKVTSIEVMMYAHCRFSSSFMIKHRTVLHKYTHKYKNIIVCHHFCCFFLQRFAIEIIVSATSLQTLKQNTHTVGRAKMFRGFGHHCAFFYLV